jgi:hypothetical protein
MPKNYEVNWNQKELLLQVRGLSLQEIDKLALEVIAESDPPIDTGFLDASAYVNSSSGLNTFDEGWPTGEYFSRRTQRDEWRDTIDAPEPPPRNGAVAGWAADYAAHVEEQTSFIYAAVQKVASNHR